MTTTLEKRFEAELWRCVRDCRALGYNPAYFAQMLDERGGLATARKLINDTRPSEGFTRLWEMKRLDLTVEAVALRSPFRELLTNDERTRSRRRLEDYGYRP